MPIERAFCRFPEFTDFGEFAIVNSNASSPESTGHLLDTFRRILADKHRIIYPIIATETILNPFNDKGDITERFAIFSTALTKTELSSVAKPTRRRNACMDCGVRLFIDPNSVPVRIRWEKTQTSPYHSFSDA